jgi:hypothetical protein
VAAEEEVKNPDTSFVIEDSLQDTDDERGEQDLETLSDFDDIDSEISGSDSASDNGDDCTFGCRQMSPEVIDALIAEVKRAHNSKDEEYDCSLSL